MKKIFCLFLAISTVTSCRGQTNSMQLNKVIHNITKSIKKYPQQPSYYMAVYSGACSFELLANDMPIYKYYDRDNIGGQSFPINMMILKSGLQNWSLKILPPAYPSKDSILPGLLDDGYFRLVLQVKDWQSGEVEMTTLDTLYEAPSIIKNKERFMADAGKPMIQANGRFNVEVPYNLPGWNNSVDLEKEDKEKLLEEVIAIYEKKRQWLKEKEFIAELEFSRSAKYEFMQSMYRSENDIRESIEEDLKIANSDEFDVPPLEHFSLKFYGNGKVVALERDDLYYRGESALCRNYKKGNSDKVIFRQVMLHRPKPNAPLEPIR